MRFKRRTWMKFTKSHTAAKFQQILKLDTHIDNDLDLLICMHQVKCFETVWCNYVVP